MKIVYLWEYFSRNFDYFENNFPAEHAQLGCRVYLISSMLKYPSSSPEVVKKYSDVNRKLSHDKKVLVIRNKSFLRLKRPMVLVPNFIKIYFQLKKIKPDVIYVGGERNFSVISAVWFAKRFQVSRVYVACHGDIYNSEKIFSRSFKVMQYLILPIYKQFIFKYVTRYFAVNEASAEFLPHMFPKLVNVNDVTIVPIGAHTNDIKNRYEVRNQYRQILGVDDDMIVFVVSGKLHKKIKNVDLILRAFNSVKHEFSHIKLLLVGSFDSEVRKIYESDDSQLIHVDFQTPSELRKYYLASDMAIWASASSSIQDAMALGLPLSLRNIKPIAWLASYKNGLLFNNEEELAEMIKKVVTNKNCLKKMSMYSVKAIENHISWRAIAEKTLRIFAEDGVLTKDKTKQ